MNYLYEESEMPYGTLSQFGLTQEMVDDLPTDVLADIYNGRKSPVLPVTIQTEDGETVEGRTRFALVRNDRDEVDLLFYPVLDEDICFKNSLKYLVTVASFATFVMC